MGNLITSVTRETESDGAGNHYFARFLQ